MEVFWGIASIICGIYILGMGLKFFPLKIKDQKKHDDWHRKSKLFLIIGGAITLFKGVSLLANIF